MLFNVCVNMPMGEVHSRACTINELLFYVNFSPFFFFLILTLIKTNKNIVFNIVGGKRQSLCLRPISYSVFVNLFFFLFLTLINKNKHKYLISLTLMEKENRDGGYLLSVVTLSICYLYFVIVISTLH